MSYTVGIVLMQAVLEVKLQIFRSELHAQEYNDERRSVQKRYVFFLVGIAYWRRLWTSKKVYLLESTMFFWEALLKHK